MEPNGNSMYVNPPRRKKSMNNLPALSSVPLPAYLQNKAVSSVTAAILTGAPTSVPRISLKQGRFRIREGQDEFVIDQTYIDVVIVGSVPAVSKMYYIKPWSPGDEPTAPDCSSLLGVRPEPESPAKQSDLCADCPKNAWGSKVTPGGKDIKACSDSRHIAVIPADDTEKVYLLSTPAASMKNLTKYVKVLGQHGRGVEFVRTRLSFDTDAEYPLLNFDFAGDLDAGGAAEVAGLLGSAQVLEVLGNYHLQPTQEAPAKLAAPKPAAKSAPTITVTDPEPEYAPEAPAQATPVAPVPIKGFGKTKVVAEPAPAPAVEPAPAPTKGFGKKKTATLANTAPVTSNAEALSALESDIDSLLTPGS